MSSEEDRAKHSARRKRNVIAKHMIDNKGAFALKVVDPRKTEYRREKINLNDLYLEEDSDEVLYGKTSDGGNL